MRKRSPYLKQLAALPLLHDCRRSDLALIAQLVDLVDIEVGEARALHNDIHHDSLVVAGRAQVVVDGRCVGTLSSGDAFSTPAAFGHAPAHVFAVALSPLRVLVVARRVTVLQQLAPSLSRRLLENRATRPGWLDRSVSWAFDRRRLSASH